MIRSLSQWFDRLWRHVLLKDGSWSREHLGLMMVRDVFWDVLFVCSKYTFWKKLTQALKKSHPNRSCRRRDFFTKNVMLVAVTLGAASETFYMKKPAKKTFRKKKHSNSSIFPTHSFTNTCKNHQKHPDRIWGSLPDSLANRRHNLNTSERQESELPNAVNHQKLGCWSNIQLEEHWNSWKKRMGFMHFISCLLVGLYHTYIWMKQKWHVAFFPGNSGWRFHPRNATFIEPLSGRIPHTNSPLETNTHGKWRF